MTDLEMVKLCAEAMGYDFHPPKKFIFPTVSATRNQLVPFVAHNSPYNPLYNDAQAMALEDWLITNHGALHFYRDHLLFYPYTTGKSMTFGYSNSETRKRAICECVAKLQERP